MEQDKEYIHSVWHVDSDRVSVTLYPNGYVALSVEEYVRAKGGNEMPQLLSDRVMEHLQVYKGKALTPSDGRSISDAVSTMVDEYFSPLARAATPGKASRKKTKK